MVFASIYVLVPATRSADIDWRKHFYSVRQLLFVHGLVMIIGVIFFHVRYLHTPLIHPYWMFHVVFLAVWIAGLATANETVQKALPIVLILTLVLSQLVVRMQTGALMAQ